jgi:hypothetical protein
VKKMFLFLLLLVASFSLLIMACPTTATLISGFVVSGAATTNGFSIDSTIPATISIVGPPNLSLNIPSPPSTSVSYSVPNVPAGTYSFSINLSTVGTVGTIGVNETIGGVPQSYFTVSPGSPNLTLMLSSLVINSNETINISLTNAS